MSECGLPLCVDNGDNEEDYFRMFDYCFPSLRYFFQKC